LRAAPHDISGYPSRAFHALRAASNPAESPSVFSRLPAARLSGGGRRPTKGAALARHKPLPPKTKTRFRAPAFAKLRRGKSAKTALRFGSPRSGLRLATPVSPTGRGAAAAAPRNQTRRKGNPAMITIVAVPHRKFDLGRIVSTPGAMDACSPAYLAECLARHARGDWGLV
jgi:hypothetical protein